MKFSDDIINKMEKNLSEEYLVKLNKDVLIDMYLMSVANLIYVAEILEQLSFAKDKTINLLEDKANKEKLKAKFYLEEFKRVEFELAHYKKNETRH